MQPMSTDRATGAASAVRVRAAGGETRAVVLVLHGGKEQSVAPTSWVALPVLRMVGFASTLHRRLGRAGVEVWRLRFAVRGWNGTAAHPVHDARRTLEQIHARHPGLPVVVVGHSMGGRVAVRVADDPQVVGIVALAPWLPDHEPVEPVRGKKVFIAHGATDRWVPGAMSLAWAQRALGTASELRRVELRGTNHPMLRRSALWHELTAYVVAHQLEIPAPAPAGIVDVTTMGTTDLRFVL
jgi:alpha-beta hydrolase superfamily lysophospholipase